MKRIVAILVIGTVLLSGCSSLDGTQSESPADLIESTSSTPGLGGEQTAPPSQTPVPTPTGTPTAGPNPTPSATPTSSGSNSVVTTVAAYPERLERWTAIYDGHRSGLSSVESFTGVYEVTVSGPDAARREGESNQTVRLKNGTRALWTSIETPRRIVTGYKNSTAAETIYGRLNASGDVSYFQESGSIPQHRFRSLREPQFFAKFNFTDRGVVETDQGRRSVYSASDVEAVDTSLLTPENVTEISLTVHVDPESGLVTLVDYSVTVDRSSGTVTLSQEIRITDIGTTTVESPAWLDEARESDS